MNEQDSQSKEQLLQEMAELRCRVAALETTAEQLKQAEERYHSVVTAMVEGVVMHQRNGEIVTCNPAAEQILGLTQDQMLGRTSIDPRWRAIHEDSRPFPGQTHPAMVTLQTGQPQRNVVMGVHKPDGRLTWISINAEPLFAPGQSEPYMVVATFRDITAQRQAEAAMRESEARFKTIFEASPVSISIIRLKDQQFIDVNQVLETRFGFSREEMMGRTPLELNLWVNPDQREWMFKQLHEQGSVQGLEVRMRLKSGALVDVLMSAKLIEIAGEPCLLTLTQDITESKRLEAALRESNERQEMIIKGSDLGTWDWHVPSGSVVFNERWAEMLGYTLAEIEPEVSSWEKLVHPDDVSAVMAALKAHLEGHTPLYQTEHRLRHKSGEWKWVLDIGRVLERDEQGQPVRVVGIHQNITERKQAEAALRASEVRFKTIFHASPIGMSISRVKDYRFLEVNKAIQLMTGFSPEETIGRTSLELKLWVNSDDRERLLGQLREQGTVYDFEARVRHKSGAVMELLMSAELIEVAGELCLLILSRDITAQKQAEKALRESEARFRTIFQASPLPISILRLSDERFVDVNPAWETISGLSREETIGRTTPELGWQVNSGDRKRVFRQLREQGGVQGVEVQIRSKSGAVVNMLTSGEVIEVAGELCLLRLSLDITARKRMEETLRASEQNLQAILSATSEVIFLIDTAGHVLTANDAARERILGSKTADLSGKNVFDLLPPEMAQPRRASVDEAIRTGQPVQFIDYQIGLWIDQTVYPIFDAGGQVNRLVIFATDISQRKQAETALRESEARFRTIFQLSPVPISIQRLRDQCFIDVNPAWERLGGFSREEIIGRSTPEFSGQISPADRDRMLRLLREQGGVYNVEAQTRSKSGAVIEVLTSIELIEVEGELCMLRLSMDITARKQMEVALRASEQKLRQIIERSGDGVVLTDEAGRVVEWNPVLEQITGLERAAVLGQPSWEIQFQMHPPERRAPALYERIKTLSQLALQSGHNPQPSRPIEAEIQRLDGSYRDIQSLDFSIQNGSGFLIGSVIRDVTRRKQIERVEAIQLAVNHILAGSPEVEDALPQILEAIARRMGWDLAKLWWPNNDGSHLVWRGGWHVPDLLGLAELVQVSCGYTFERGEGLTGAVWQEGQAIWDNDLRLSKLAAAVLATGLHSATGVPIIADGETVAVMSFFSRSARPLDERLLAVLTNLGRQIGQFLIRKQVEADLADERASLAQRVEERTAELSRALRVKDEFMTTMNHELRTPLSPILAIAEALQDGIYGHLSERQLRQVRRIEESSEHLLAMVNDILDLTNLEAGNVELQPEMVAAGEVCRASVQAITASAQKKNLALACHLPDQPLYLQADPHRLKQILGHLLNNAVKFTPAGGQVSLEVSPDPADGLIHFAVQDNGIGIKPEQMERLFQPFTQFDSSLARSYDGAGLGLALVRRLVELHSGTVMVESEGVSGQGSRFTVSLPRRLPTEKTTTP